MNICAKINSMAEPNGIVIGGDLYQIVKSFYFVNSNNNGYEFRELREGYSVGFNQRYAVFTALSKSDNNNTAELNINHINHFLGPMKFPR